MRVVFLEDVAGVANGGEVKEVKNGFARNYLIPKNLAVPASHNALQGVEHLKKQADSTRVKLLTDMSALAEELNGIQVQVEMRAGTGGRLYGSVTNAMVAEQLQAVTGREIDRRLIEIPDPIRQLGTFEIAVRLHPEVQADISVLVYASGTDPTMLDEQQEEAIEDGEPGVDNLEDSVPSVDEDAATPEDEEEAIEEDATTTEDIVASVEDDDATTENNAAADTEATATIDETAPAAEGEADDDVDKTP